MTKQEFNSYLDELTSETGFDLTKEQKAFAYHAAEQYHEQALRIHGVVGRSEQFICPCCGSDKTYKTEAYHCNRCAVTTEV